MPANNYHSIMRINAMIVLLAWAFFSPVLYAQLTGEWTDENGACYRIRQVGNVVYWNYEDLPRVENVFTGYLAKNILTGTWADLPGGQIMGSGTLSLRVESNNRMVKIAESDTYQGSVITRGACRGTTGGGVTRPDLSGTWYDYSASTGNAGLASSILQDGDKLTFVNSFNNRSDGRFIDAATVIANAWEGGLRARLEDNNRRIVWANGSVWQRDKR